MELFNNWSGGGSNSMGRIGITLGLLVCVSCAGADGSDGERGRSGEDSLSALSRIDEDDCPSGGVVLSVGVDEDGDGSLDSDEIQDSEAICNGEDGEQGPQGDAGSEGEQGPQGEAGEPGAQGDPGEEGDQGPQGDPGEDGDTTRIVESFYCGGGLENTTLAFTYNAVLMNSGDLFTTASVRSPLDSASGTSFYSPAQNGYQTASVILRYDQDGTADGGWFELYLDRENLTTYIDYYASGSDPLTQSWVMDPEACVHNFY